ncbi:MAG: nuclear transport factor 2 family protein [Deltaproteobacteria bacterium]
MPNLQEEIRDAYARLVATRDRVERGELGWSELAGFFAEDAVFVDPAWGRVQGRPAIQRFMQESMAGLEGWTFPHLWTMVEGTRLVSAWMNRLPGQRADGTFYEVPGLSVMEYAGDGLFASEYDHLNMVHVFEVMQESGWKPTGKLNIPPNPVPR